MHLHCDKGNVMKKHCRECLADWAKENRVVNWEKIYQGNHPKEIAKRNNYALRQHNERQRRKEDKKEYK